MKNIVLILMLLISACGKENSAVAHYCLNGMYKQDGADVYYMFKPNGQVGFDTVALDGCFYVGTYNCDDVAGTLSVNLTTPSAPECGTGSATFNYSTTMTTLSLEINGSTTTWSL